jgi:hypothetical protein
MDVCAYVMALHVAFEKSANSFIKKVVKAIAGPYVHTELIISQSQPSLVHTSYAAYMSENFSRTMQPDFWYEDQSHDFLSIRVSHEELRKISDTCEACVETKIPYNTSDMVMSIIPMRNPKERSIYQAGSLFCSQSIVLMLRSCLDAEHPLQLGLASVNSRTITPSQLYILMRPHCSPSCVKQVLKG